MSSIYPPNKLKLNLKALFIPNIKPFKLYLLNNLVIKSLWNFNFVQFNFTTKIKPKSLNYLTSPNPNLKILINFNQTYVLVMLPL